MENYSTAVNGSKVKVKRSKQMNAILTLKWGSLIMSAVGASHLFLINNYSGGLPSTVNVHNIDNEFDRPRCMRGSVWVRSTSTG